MQSAWVIIKGKPVSTTLGSAAYAHCDFRPRVELLASPITIGGTMKIYRPNLRHLLLLLCIAIIGRVSVIVKTKMTLGLEFSLNTGRALSTKPCSQYFCLRRLWPLSGGLWDLGALQGMHRI